MLRIAEKNNCRKKSVSLSFNEKLLFGSIEIMIAKDLSPKEIGIPYSSPG